MSKIKKRVTFAEIKELGILPWDSWKTTKRKIKNESFPAYCESNHYYFDLDEIEIWFKKRKVTSAA